MARERKPIAVAASSSTKRPRTRAALAVEKANYFASTSSKEEAGLEFFSTGCAGLDAALGGGWVLGRVSNVVGDKSAGKTLLAIEACANFALTFSDGLIRYAEAENAFDQAYAEQMGMPEGRVLYNERGESMETVAGWEKDLRAFLAKCKEAKVPGLYILDSLDAIEADEDDLKAAITEAGFGGKKPKMIGALFRKLVSELEEARIHLMVVSQLRDKLGVTFGETKTRSGGKALDYYATHIVWIATVGQIQKTRGGIKRNVGVDCKAKVKKNKVGLPFREFEYSILYGYGIDDMLASATWLIENKRAEEDLAALELTKTGHPLRLAAIRERGGQEAHDMRQALRNLLIREWESVENDFLPKSKKYG